MTSSSERGQWMDVEVGDGEGGEAVGAAPPASGGGA